MRSFNPKNLLIFRCLIYESDTGVFFFCLPPPFPAASCVLTCTNFFFSSIDTLVGKVQYLQVRLCFLLVTPAKKAVFAPDGELADASAVKCLHAFGTVKF